MSVPSIPVRAEILSRTLDRIARMELPADPERVALLKRWAEGELTTDELVRASGR